MTTMTANVAALVLAVATACGGGDKIVNVVQDDVAYCPHNFDYALYDSVADYEEATTGVVISNDFSMHLLEEGIVQGEGAMYVQMKWRDGVNGRNTAVVKVLWPFLGYYRWKSDTLQFRYTQSWLDYDDVVTTRVDELLQTMSVNPAVTLAVTWGRC